MFLGGCCTFLVCFNPGFSLSLLLLLSISYNEKPRLHKGPSKATSTMQATPSPRWQDPRTCPPGSGAALSRGFLERRPVLSVTCLELMGSARCSVATQG